MMTKMYHVEFPAECGDSYFAPALRNLCGTIVENHARQVGARLKLEAIASPLKYDSNDNLYVQDSSSFPLTANVKVDPLKWHEAAQTMAKLEMFEMLHNQLKNRIFNQSVSDNLLGIGVAINGHAPKRRGRPCGGDKRKVPYGFRIDPDILAALRAMGPNFNRKVNTLLKKFVDGEITL